MELLTETAIISGVAIMATSWVVTTWMRIKNGYPLENSWGKAVYPKNDQAVERVKLLTQENAELRAELGSLSEFNLDTAWGKRALKQLLQASYEGTGPAVAALTSGAGAPPIAELQPKLQAALELLGAGDAKEREKLEVRRFLCNPPMPG